MRGSRGSGHLAPAQSLPEAASAVSGLLSPGCVFELVLDYPKAKFHCPRVA